MKRDNLDFEVSNEDSPVYDQSCCLYCKNIIGTGLNVRFYLVQVSPTQVDVIRLEIEHDLRGCYTGSFWFIPRFPGSISLSLSTDHDAKLVPGSAQMPTPEMKREGSTARDEANNSCVFLRNKRFYLEPVSVTPTAAFNNSDEKEVVRAILSPPCFAMLLMTDRRLFRWHLTGSSLKLLFLASVRENS